MSVLFLHFESPERESRVQKLSKSGARVVVSEPRWPGFHEVAKKEKPFAIAIDFSLAPSHSLETADYLAKAKETKETPLYLLRVPEDRQDIVRKRLPQAFLVSEQELSGKLAEIERQAIERARLKKQAAAEARKLARAKNAKPAAAPVKSPPAAVKAKPKKPTPPARPPARKKPAARKPAGRKRPSRVPKKK